VGAGLLVVACLPMAAVVWLTREQPLVVPVLVGAATYGAACLAVRAVTLNDVRTIIRHLVERQSAQATVT